MAPDLPPQPIELTRRLRLDLDNLPPEDLAALEAALEDATALALDAVPATVADRWRLVAPPAVRVIVLKAARREFENPRGALSESVGGHFMSLPQAGTSGVYLTHEERHLLATLAAPGHARGLRGRRAGTVRVRAAWEDLP